MNPPVEYLDPAPLFAIGVTEEQWGRILRLMPSMASQIQADHGFQDDRAYLSALVLAIAEVGPRNLRVFETVNAAAESLRAAKARYAPISAAVANELLARKMRGVGRQ